MKIEIDLNDILGDENGAETLQESVRRQVVDSLSTSIRKGVQSRINEETTRIMNEELQKVLIEQMPALVDDVMNTAYTPVSSYGQRSEPTTFRNELVKAIGSNMVYKKAQYDSDKSAFTKAVDAVIGEQVAAFKKSFDAMVDAEFKRDALTYAVTKLSERLNIKS